ncbi:ribosomal RNA small subunit methyltransferase H [Bacilli bacterium]|nr:ribosomal RNA small subunit methyltransferase H [Bacilli bacterium]
MKPNSHQPVLLKESIELLNIKPNGIYVDGTAGRGGHSQAILDKLNLNGKLICIDTDQDAIDSLEKKFRNKNNVIIVKGNFTEIDEIVKTNKINKVDGILLDIGVSSPMFDDILRGFSYHNSSKLDMRMDQTQKLDAHYIVNNYSIEQLINVFKKYGEIANPYNVAKKIIEQRIIKPINATDELVNIIKTSIPSKILFKEKHPAKQYFQALRIEVNDELNNLQKVIDHSANILNANGVLAIISFHSLEDRIVKQKFLNLTSINVPKEIPISNITTQFSLLTKKPITASDNELLDNLRSRSAKLRAVIKN